jgi:hypothetical protein
MRNYDKYQPYPSWVAYLIWAAIAISLLRGLYVYFFLKN